MDVSTVYKFISASPIDPDRFKRLSEEVENQKVVEVSHNFPGKEELEEMALDGAGELVPFPTGEIMKHFPVGPSWSKFPGESNVTYCCVSIPIDPSPSGMVSFKSGVCPPAIFLKLFCRKKGSQKFYFFGVPKNLVGEYKDGFLFRPLYSEFCIATIWECNGVKKIGTIYPSITKSPPQPQKDSLSEIKELFNVSEQKFYEFVNSRTEFFIIDE